MKTALECLPCLLRQTLHTARLATKDPKLQLSILNAVSRLLPTLDHRLSPPENSVPVYNLIAKLSNCPDPYRVIKQESNKMALAICKDLPEVIKGQDDPLLAAIMFAIAGNIIDYGSRQSFDADKAINNCLESELALNDYHLLTEDLKNAERILYLADNCGEIAFDRLVLEQLPARTTMVVKDGPIINDALLVDAKQCEIEQVCRVIGNGTNCPGTPLGQCSETLQDEFARADIIISKGQGNFETLSETPGPIYFLLTIKCPVVADHIQDLSGRPAANGDLVLFRQNP